MKISHHGLALGLLVAVTLALSTGCAGVGNLTATAPAAPAAAAAPAAPKANVWSQTMEAKRVALEAATADSGISILRTQDNELQANVPSDFSFDTDSATLKPSMKAVLDHFAADLDQAGLSQMRILIVGHTDSRGPEAANDALSLARAHAVARYLEFKGTPPARIRVEGRGEHEPLIDDDMAVTRALNRRVEMFLSEPAD